MLIGIDALLDGQILKGLCDMGHGDELAIVDSNYPAFSTAQSTVLGSPLKMLGASAPQALAAVLSVMPLDSFEEHVMWRMEVVGDAQHIPAVQREAQQEVDRLHGPAITMQRLDRFEFYRRAKSCYAVLVTGETRAYGCFILKKGVIFAATGVHVDAPESATPSKTH